MTSGTVTIPIAEVSPGMRLAKPVANAAGVTLMPAGVRLTPMFITRLKKWNIATVTVAAPPAPPKPPPVSAATTRRFVPQPGNPAPGATAAPGASTAAPLLPDDNFSADLMQDMNRRFANVAANPLMVVLRDAALRRLLDQGPGSYFNRMRVAARDQEEHS